MNPQLQLILQQAIQAFQDGEFDRAGSLLKRVIQVDKKNLPALHVLGLIKASQAQFREAADLLGRAARINPADPSIQYNLAKALADCGADTESIPHHRKAVELAPNNPEAWLNYGKTVSNLGRYEDALAHYEKAIALNPGFAEAALNKGATLKELKRYEEAIEFAERALTINPSLVEGWVNKGVALKQLKRYEEAIDHFDKAISLRPDYAEAWNNKGTTLNELKRYEEAIDHFDKAISLRPDYVEVFYNKGCLFHTHVKKYSEASANYDKAIHLKPEYVDAYWNKSHLKLLMGEYQEGWNLFEWRWKLNSLKLSARNYPQPLWLGNESLFNKTILIWAEQGLGDTIQFCRYIKMVSDLGARVILEVQAPLAQSLSTLDGVSEIILAGENVTNFDFHCPMLSLPLAFKTTLETIPNEVPYLRPNPNKTAHWRAKLGEKRNLRVGLVWSGGFRKDQPETWSVNRRRNIPLAKLKSLNLPNIDFYSLQKGKEAEEELAFLQSSGWDGPEIIDFTKDLNDYSDTAALIANLDLVISVDTSVAHMTGAIGKAIWILNRFDTDWRWLADRSDSPWYPTAIIFNQTAYENWDSVIENVRIKLMGQFTHT